MNFNTVKKRSRDTFLLFGNDSRGTRTGLLGIIPMATRTGMYTIAQVFVVFQEVRK